MFIALISTIISSFSDVFWQKSLSYNVRYLAHSLASFPVWIILCLYFIIYGFDFSGITTIGILSVFIILLIDIVCDPIVQKIYREEKMSVLMPYFNLNKIFVIISSFFIFQDVSYISLCITIFTAMVITLAAIDRKHKRLPKNFAKIVFVESLTSVWILLGWWMILSHGEIIYFILYVFFWAMMYSFLSLYTWQYKDLKGPPLRFWKYRCIWGLGWVSWFLSLVVIKNLWLSISILLWFLWVWVTLIIAYIFSKDIPSRKNISLTLIVALLIGAGYYFK